MTEQLLPTEDCPLTEMLHLFALGRLSDQALEQVGRHLERCPSCVARLQSSDFVDPLLEICHLRDVETPVASTPGLQLFMNRMKQLSSPVPPLAQEKAPPASLLGRYRLLQTIGSGGMGTVYQAEDQQLKRVVAVKVPRFAGTAEQQHRAKQRFLREGHLAAQVRHPNVCTLHDAGQDGETPFVVMEFVGGRALDAELTQRGRFEDCPTAVRLAVQVARGLEAIHQKGIIHRDLKPANILITPAGNAVITDFGLATPGDADGTITLEGYAVGTPAYMSPEQVSAARPIDHRSDLFSLGCILYQMLTGRLPFEGTPQEQLWQRTTAKPPAPTQLRPDMDTGLETILLGALATRPGDRPASAAAFAEALEGWLKRQTPAPLPRLDPKGFGLAIFLGVLLLIGGGALLAGRYFWTNLPIATLASLTSIATPKGDGLVLPERSDRAFDFGFVNRAVYSPILPMVAISTPNNSILLVDVKSGKVLHTLTGHGPCQLWALAISPDGKRLLSGGDDNQIVLWDLDERKILQRFTGHKEAIKRVSFTADKTRIVSASDDRTIRTWDTRTGREVALFAFVQDALGIHATAFSPDGSRFLNGRRDGSLEWFDVSNGNLLCRWPAHKEAVRSVAVSPDGTEALSGGEDDRLCLWDVSRGQLLADLKKQVETPYLVAFLPSGHRAIGGGPGGAVSLWDLDGRRLERRWKEHRFALSSLRPAPSGNEFLSLSGHGELRFWRLTPS